ncbi:PIN domain-containing protein (plasmid) [Novosphingobium sp. BL-8A]|uniref:PIN domain-containing protein n=1 Tax=Novosphingobium sp. BL-8A TaxID=3127639 RepID=UPI0037579304
MATDPGTSPAPVGLSDATQAHEFEVRNTTGDDGPRFSSHSPVLYIDTCSVLDIMRDPTRKTPGAHDRIAAIDVVDAVETGRVRCIFAQQVSIEFEQHCEATHREAQKGIDRVKAELANVTSAARVFGKVPDIELGHFDGHVENTRSLVARLVGHREVVVPEAIVHSQAYARMNMGRAPASLGKESSKDCLVYLTVLEHAKALRQSGHTGAMVFLSSNTNDYTTAARKARPEILEDFGQLGMEYAPGMGAAWHLLGLQSGPGRAA